MTKRMATAGMFVAFLCTGSALAQAVAREPSGAPRALPEYRSTTQHALIACASAFAPRQARVRVADAVGDYRSCVVRVQGEVAAKLAAALRSLEPTECVPALREYHLAFERALVGIEPSPGEGPFAYEQRQAFLFHAMAHAWGRFEIAEATGY